MAFVKSCGGLCLVLRLARSNNMKLNVNQCFTAARSLANFNFTNLTCSVSPRLCSTLAYLPPAPLSTALPFQSHIQNSLLLRHRGNCSVSQMKHSHSKSEGDQQFIEFLTKEIAVEKESSKELPSVSGFTVTTNGPLVTLVKQIDGETVTVEFSVNDSVTVESDESEEVMEMSNEQKESPPEMMSTPDFKVTLAKDGHKSKLCMKCQMVDPVVNRDVPKDEADSFEIVELTMTEQNWDENTYFANADLLDGSMYDMLMLLLDERGINHTTFYDELVQFSTEYEHESYIKLLESLQKFVQK